ncbi:acyltransferase family protein [Cytobacillus firmus]|uniref:acyltransferase family protein n=1 Tax=Cytobacillus firmus TaxID=1399 RepID=UPI0021C62DD0|nr:acyltransferase family protein [Cytobacillus firmus]MCU1807076.1 acyltransferase family protein [Cytobacillus firmus]
MTTKKGKVNEIFFIRSIACICVVLLHAIGIVTREFGVTPDTLFSQSRLLLLFATPLFIILSEFLLAYSYPEKTPRNFFSKRLKYILIPFIIMAFIYSLDVNLRSAEFDLNSIWNIFLINLTGGFHGYFILIIFQFYLLHVLFIKFEHKLSPKMVLFISLVINVLYLSFFNLTDPPENLAHGQEIWRRWYWYPFVGWIFYFTLAYYCGKYFDLFKARVQRYIIPILFAIIISVAVIYTAYTNFIIPSMSSKRVDILFYATLMWFLLFYIATKIKKVPKFVIIISKLSFGIYLLHPIFFRMLQENIDPSSSSNIYVYFTIIFLMGFLLSALTTYLLSLTKVGQFIIGATGKMYKKQKEHVKGLIGNERQNQMQKESTSA